MPTHAGFYSTTISGTVVNGDNVNYGTLPGAQGELTVAGQFPIATGVGFPGIQIRSGTITSPLGTISIGYLSPAITIDIVGGAPTTAFNVQAFVGPGTNPVVPTAGAITVNGTLVAAQSIPVRSISLAASTLNIELQIASASVLDDVTQNGLCHFDSSQFSVSATGFVQSLTSGGITWQDFAPGALVFSNGYFATGAGAYTLPLGTTDGQTIEIVDQAGGGVVVTAAGAQLIQISNVLSSAGGTATSTLSGDALRLIFRATLGSWICVPGVAGNWILA